MRNLNILLFFFILPFSGLSDYCWSPRAPMGLGDRYAAMGFTISNKLYVGCGYNGAGMNDFWEFDPASNTWTQKASFPGGSIWAGMSFAINGKGYFGLGTSGTSFPTALYEYDPAMDAWTQKASFPSTGRQDCHSFAVNNFGYVVGGWMSGNYYDELYRYDPVSDSWSIQASFPGGPRDGLRGFVIGSTAYVGTGLSFGALHSDMYKYNPSSNTWTAVAAFPGSFRHSVSAFEMNSKGIMGGGFGASNTTFTDFFEFDPTLNLWTSIPAFPGLPRSYTVCGTLLGNGYVSTGRSGNSAYSNETWMLTSIQQATINTTIDSCNLTVSFASNASTSDSVYWDFGDGTSTSLQTPVHTFTSSGNFNVTLTITNGFCTTSASQLIALAPRVLSSFNLTSDCSNTVIITNTSSNAQNFQWSWGNGQSSQGIQTTYTYSQPGIYTVNLIAMNGSCQDTSSQTITLNMLPVAQANTSQNPCSDSIFFSSQNPAQNYSWSFGDNTSDSASSGTHHYAGPGTYQVILTLSESGCTDVDTIIVVIPEIPKALFQYTLRCDGFFEASANTGNNWTYYWNFGDGNSGNGPIVSHNFANIGSYLVTLTTSEGLCIDTTTNLITPSPLIGLEHLFLPNAFTPNNDGVNDMYCISDTLCQEAEMAIFNRWGSEIFRTKDIKKGWDGTFQNNGVPEGVYIVIIENDFSRKSGLIMLLR